MARRPSRDAPTPRQSGVVRALIIMPILILIVICLWHLGIIAYFQKQIDTVLPMSSSSSSPPPLSPSTAPVVMSIAESASSSPIATDRGTVMDHFEAVFPDNEASFINKPYLSSVAQCHLTSSGIACTPPLRNVRWKEPLEETHIYDLDSAPARSLDLPPPPASPCLTSLQGF